MNLILIKPAERSADTDTIDLPSDDERAKHIRSHLNKTTGDTVSIGFIDSDGGSKGQAVVLQLQNGGMRLVPIAETIVQSSKLPEITLVLAVPFPARLKYLWSVIASFSAVTRIVILKGKLSNPEFCESSALKQSVYEPMIEKGMSQGGRTRPIKVDVAIEDGPISRESLERLGLVCTDNADGTARIFLDCGDEHETPPPARDMVIQQWGEFDGKVPSAIVAVGPERGWTEEEANVFVKEGGFSSAMLGCSILRVDTAVVAGLGIVSAALDECHAKATQSTAEEGESNRQSDSVDCKRQRLGEAEPNAP